MSVPQLKGTYYHHNAVVDDIKIVVGGPGGVGKSALTIRFVTDNFLDEYDPTIEDSYRKQVVVVPATAMLNIQPVTPKSKIPDIDTGIDCKIDMIHGQPFGVPRLALVDILDTAGPEEYSSMREQWMRDTDVMIFAFSLVSKPTWDEIEGWRAHWERVSANQPPQRPTLLVGTKSDLVIPDGQPVPIHQPRSTNYYYGASNEYSHQCVPTAEIEAYALRHNMVYITSSSKERFNVDRVFATAVRMHWMYQAKFGTNAKGKGKARMTSKKCAVQ